MKELNYNKLDSQYYDTYHKITHISFINIENKQRIYLPILPEDMNNNPSKPISKLPKQSLDVLIDVFNQIDTLLVNNPLYKDKYSPYSCNSGKIIVDTKKGSKKYQNLIMLYLLFENGSYLSLNKEIYSYQKYKIQTSQNKSLIYLIENYLHNIQIPNDYTNSIQEYNQNKNIEYNLFINLYLQIRKNEEIKNEILSIKNHPIMINIHKRQKILLSIEKLITTIKKERLKLVKKIIQSSKKKQKYQIIADEYQNFIQSFNKKNKSYLIKKFIEFIMNNDFHDLDKIFIYNYLSLDNLIKENDIEFFFTHKQILNNEHDIVFQDLSIYQRQISYYQIKNPKQSKHMKKLKDKNNLVSFFTSYPHKMKLYFGSSFRLYKHYHESLNDFFIIDYAIQNESLNDSIIKQSLIDLIDLFSEEIINDYNEWSSKNYETKQDIIESIQSNDYEFTYQDLYLLSFQLSDIQNDVKYGFCLYTNQYGENEKDFQLFIIINDEVLVGDLKNIKMICLYQDYQSDDKVLKNIIFPQEKRMISLETLYTNNELMKRNDFKKLWDDEFQLEI